MITRQIKTMSWEKPYVSPEIHTLDIKSEGMLCLSFGPASTGFMIDDATEEDGGPL